MPLCASFTLQQRSLTLQRIQLTPGCAEGVSCLTLRGFSSVRHSLSISGLVPQPLHHSLVPSGWPTLHKMFVQDNGCQLECLVSGHLPHQTSVSRNSNCLVIVTTLGQSLQLMQMGSWKVMTTAEDSGNAAATGPSPKITWKF